MLKNILFIFFFLCILHAKSVHALSKIVDEISVIVNQDVFLKSDIDAILKKNFSYSQKSGYANLIQNNLKNEILNYLISDYIVKSSISKNIPLSNNSSTGMTKKINANTSEMYIKYHEIKKKINVNFYELDTLSKLIFLRENNILLNLAHFIIPLKNDSSIDDIHFSNNSQFHILNLIKNPNIPKKKL